MPRSVTIYEHRHPMKLRIYSDLHVEFEKFDITPLDDDKDTVLILAGDINCNAFDGLRWASRYVERFKRVVYVLGNHEFYETDMGDMSYLESYAVENGIDLLQDSFIVVDDVVIYGCTLWTDFNRCNPVVMNEAKYFMFDYTAIKLYGVRITPEWVYGEHVKSVLDIRQFFVDMSLNEDKSKVIMVTHHCPVMTYETLDPRFSGRNSNYYFNCTDMDNLMSNVDHWIFGHSHYNIEEGYTFDGCQLHTNQRGYPNENPHTFKPLGKIIDV